MLEAASSGAQFSPGLSSAQTARAAGLKGRDPSRGPRAETVLGMVAPARPQRQQAAGYGGRYTSNATGWGWYLLLPQRRRQCCDRYRGRWGGRRPLVSGMFPLQLRWRHTRVLREPASTHRWMEEMVQQDGVRSRQRQLHLSLLRLCNRLWTRL